MIQKTIPFFLGCCLILITYHIYGQPLFDPSQPATTAATTLTPSEPEIEIDPELLEQETVTLDLTNEPLSSLVTSLAEKKGLKVILPQGANNMKEKVTLKYSQQLTTDAVWQLIVTLLDMADYTITQRENEISVISKKSPDSLREPTPLYVGIPSDELPASDGIIRYLYYLSNIKATTETDSELAIVLRELISPNGTFRLDPSANAVLIIDKANNVKSVMKFVTQLDQSTYQEKVDFIRVAHADVIMVANLLNEFFKLGSGDGTHKYNLDLRKQTESLYFARGTRVFPIVHNNTLMIMGRPQAVERVKEFVRDQVDVEIATGKSILHVYPLQYLNAESFAPTLQRIVESSRAGGTGQSEAQAGQPANVRGTERTFDEIIIRADKPADAEERQYYGGNKLIIAARNEDYEEIVALIQKLDTPRRIVLLEVAIADLSVLDTRLLGAITRNPDKIPIFNKMQFQAAHLEPGIIADRQTNPTTIAGDLLRKSLDANGVRVDPEDAVASITKLVPSGATAISLNDNDGQTWSMLEVLKLFAHSKIISHPHVVAIDNKLALVKLGESRLLEDESTEGLGGATVRKRKEIEAELKVEITPRISADETVNMKIEVTINDFISGTNAQTTREASTTVNVKSGNIFALAGLSSVTNNTSGSETPGIAKIPVIGWLFKRKQGRVGENNLTVFISPTIIEPRLRKGVSEYTQNYINMTNQFNRETDLFDNVRDPITRWFFKSGGIGNVDTEQELERFIAKDTRRKIGTPVNNPDLDLDFEYVPAPLPLTEEGSLQIAPTEISKREPQELQDLKVLLEDLENPFVTHHAAKPVAVATVPQCASDDCT